MPGATLITGGEPVGDTGHFYAPTILTGAPRKAAITRTEIFGPVASIRTFTDEAAALAEANDTPVGLAAYAYTADLARALRITERLDVGMIGLNRGMVSDPSAPFGGVKQSGLGREGGSEGIDEYLTTTYAAVS